MEVSAYLRQREADCSGNAALTYRNLQALDNQASFTNAAIAVAPSPIQRKRRPSLDELLPSGGGLSASLRLPPLLEPAKVPSWSDDGSSIEGRVSCTSSSTMSTSSTETARLFQLRQVQSIYKDFEESCAGGPTAVVAGKAMTFREVLALQLPRLPMERLSALATYAELDAAERKAAAERRVRAQAMVWSEAERADLRSLFEQVDADRSGLIDKEEFVAAFASGGKLGRTALEQMWKEHAGEPRGHAFEVELDFPAFMRMLEACGAAHAAIFEHVRAVLKGIAEAKAKVGHRTTALPALKRADGRESPRESPRESLLVMDDGKQQLWRLYPGGKAMVRRELVPNHLDKRPSLAERPAVLVF